MLDVALIKLTSMFVQIQLLADLNLRKTPQLVELADDADVMLSLIHFSCPIILFELRRGSV